MSFKYRIEWSFLQHKISIAHMIFDKIFTILTTFLALVDLISQDSPDL